MHESLAQVRNWINEDGEIDQQPHYFHCNQIDIPREVTDKDGNLVWFGNYTGWGRLKEESRVTDSAYQPFRLQNQYADRETGLHYNFFRYYEPDAGRFVNQDPIGLASNITNLYEFALNTQVWIDVLGLCVCLDGGSFSDMDKKKNTKTVGHHMPQNAFLKNENISRSDGPSILMTKEGHKKTRTFAGRGKKTMKDDAILNFEERFALDIKDIQDLFPDDEGCKKAIKKAIQYAKSQKWIGDEFEKMFGFIR